jgi:sulfite exporter TauE/SafE
MLEALVLGISFGFGPCITTCAPVIVPFVASTSSNYKEGLKSTVVFSAGKVLSYTLLGTLSGLLGMQLEQIISAKVVGLFMIIMAAFVFFDFHKKCLCRKIRVTNNRVLFTAGIVMGLTPCGPMLAALALAVLSKSWLTGGAIGLVFGLGTMLSPLLVIGMMSGAWARRVAQNPEFARMNRIVCSLFLALIGGLYLLT